jgi:hypothetical protein
VWTPRTNLAEGMFIALVLIAVFLRLAGGSATRKLPIPCGYVGEHLPAALKPCSARMELPRDNRRNPGGTVHPGYDPGVSRLRSLCGNRLVSARRPILASLCRTVPASDFRSGFLLSCFTGTVGRDTELPCPKFGLSCEPKRASPSWPCRPSAVRGETQPGAVTRARPALAG